MTSIWRSSFHYNTDGLNWVSFPIAVILLRKYNGHKGVKILGETQIKLECKSSRIFHISNLQTILFDRPFYDLKAQG